MSKTQYIAAGTIPCPQCRQKMQVHWTLLQQGIDPQCQHCGLVLKLELQSSAESLAAAAKLNDAFVAANKHQQAGLPPRRS
jgi:transcription elongation factor Elf1